MNMHRRQFLHTSLCAGAALALTRSPAFADMPSQIRLGTLVPKGSSYYLNLHAMGEKWTRIANGGLKFTIYPNGVMGGDMESVRRIRQGQLQAGLLTAVGLRAIEPAVTGLQNLPLMFHDLDDVDYVGQQLQPKLEQLMLQKNFVVLFWADAGWVRFFTKVPVRTPDEMKRLKLFCWAGEPDQFELMRNMGLNPVSLETSDILVGLRTGLIDAVPMPPFAALAAQVDTAAPHMLELNYAPLVGAAVIRKDVWDQIPAETQAQFMTAAQEAGRVIKKDSRAEAVTSVAAMKKRGLNVHVPTAGQVADWRNFLETKAYPTVRGKIVPTAIFDEVKALLQARHAANTGLATGR